MNGLYFYKLVSPYKDDATKDCKLTVNEIDHNFLSLKDADIKSASLDSTSNTLILKRNDGETIDADLNGILDAVDAKIDGITRDLEVEYDEVEGVINISYNDEKVVISGLLTKENTKFDDPNDIRKGLLSRVYVDGSIVGEGTKLNPIGISPLEKSGNFRPADSLIDVVNGEKIPQEEDREVGERFVTREFIDYYGYLYNFKGAMMINEEVQNGGWRIPTKEDWDSVLNAIEPCDEYRNHDSLTANVTLGRYAGSLLKSVDEWEESSDKGEVVEIKEECIYEPKKIVISPKGVDEFGMTLRPAGYADGADVAEYYSKRGYFWTQSQISETDVYVKRFDFDKSGVVQTVESPCSYFSIRLMKEYDGENYSPVTTINGETFETVLLPTLKKNESGETEVTYTIWTTKNVDFGEERFKPMLPNNGEGGNGEIAYYINEWNGTDWDKKRLYEGESISIVNGKDDEGTNLYMMVDGELVNLVDNISSSVYDKIESALTSIEDELEVVSDIANTNSERIEELSGTTEELASEIEGLKEREISGGTYSIEDGKLTLIKNNGDTIEINLTSDYGELPQLG